MKKLKVFTVMLLSLAIVFAGSSVAYYNTKSFGYDEDAVFFERNKDSIVFLDRQIYYSDIERTIKEASPYLPKEACTTQPYISNGVVRLYYIMYI